jgi:hypothetical protein
MSNSTYEKDSVDESKQVVLTAKKQVVVSESKIQSRQAGRQHRANSFASEEGLMHTSPNGASSGRSYSQSPKLMGLASHSLRGLIGDSSSSDRKAMPTPPQRAQAASPDLTIITDSSFVQAPTHQSPDSPMSPLELTEQGPSSSSSGRSGLGFSRSNSKLRVQGADKGGGSVGRPGSPVERIKVNPLGTSPCPSPPVSPKAEDGGGGGVGVIAHAQAMGVTGSKRATSNPIPITGMQRRDYGSGAEPTTPSTAYSSNATSVEDDSTMADLAEMGVSNSVSMMEVWALHTRSNFTSTN